MGQQPDIYQLKVTLADSEPEVWRRILVSGPVTLHELHDILQRAMGWQNQHEYRFQLSLGASQPACNLEQSLATVLQPVGEQPIYYTYDPQDGWLHRLEVEALDQAVEGDLTTPVCIAGAAACPPEGAGGVWGYDELLARLDDPEDPDYMSLIEDYSDFDPEAFDLAAVNARLQQF
ncbi:plasmid pRiA4b ORF-3 family protein [soil metagenome]